RRPGVDRRRLELLQPPRAAARGRPGDSRPHPAARSLPEGASPRCGGAGEVMAKLYTRRGDAGETGLLGPERVSKDDPRVEAMGTVDELNAVIGLAIAAQRDRRIRDLLSKIQDLLRYMNRLSSLLYQMAAWEQHKQRKRAEHPTYTR